MAAAEAAENHGDAAWSDTYDEGYVHQFHPDPLTKFTSSRRNTEFKDIPHGTSLKW